MQNVSDKPVKWIGDDGGWKVGRVVLTEIGCFVWDGVKILVREEHDATLSWVRWNHPESYVVSAEYK